MKGVERRERKYVEVVADFSEDGRVTPLVIVWDDGRRFPIDRVVDGRWAANMKLGGRGYRYTVMVGGRERLLWRDENRWYVEMKVLDGGPALLSQVDIARGADDEVWRFTPA